MASPRKIELLAPARTADVGIAAINHGADAVYIGPEAFGARRQAANGIDDIRRLADHAHIYRARVYATVNTLLLPSELKRAERLAWRLYRAGVDALIVQDMGMLRLDLPPIELHASTQCDIRTPAKARFLADAGFSQIVLARELTEEQIREIAGSVDVPVETFVHGALCVSYSGRCHASHLCMERSANRGECAQMCRLPYTLTDADGQTLGRTGHLLSLHDLNLSDRIEALLDAGVSSLKIEGRLKEAAYVKNITAHYRRRLDGIIAASPEKYTRSSVGRSEPGFTPVPEKSFNRGFTHYFLDSRRPAEKMSSPLTPKSLGETVERSALHPGDGIAFITPDGTYAGARVNRVNGGRIMTFGNVKVPHGVELRRTFDRLHTEEVERSEPRRCIDVDIELTQSHASITDETGLSVTMSMPADARIESPKNVAKVRDVFAKLGNTPYRLRHFTDSTPDGAGLRPSRLTALRRELVEALLRNTRIIHVYGRRRREKQEAVYPEEALTFADNVANTLAEKFYRAHGVRRIEPALEGRPKRPSRPVRAMTCRYCILRELDLCLQTPEGSALKRPLWLTSGDNRFELRPDCGRCEMDLIWHPKQ